MIQIDITLCTFLASLYYTLYITWEAVLLKLVDNLFSKLFKFKFKIQKNLNT